MLLIEKHGGDGSKATAGALHQHFTEEILRSSVCLCGVVIVCMAADKYSYLNSSGNGDDR